MKKIVIKMDSYGVIQIPWTFGITTTPRSNRYVMLHHVQNSVAISLISDAYKMTLPSNLCEIGPRTTKATQLSTVPVSFP